MVYANMEKFSVDDRIAAYARTGEGWNGESYAFYTDASGDFLVDGDIVLQGATVLPDSTEEITLEALEHSAAHWGI